MEILVSAQACWPPSDSWGLYTSGWGQGGLCRDVFGCLCFVLGALLCACLIALHVMNFACVSAWYMLYMLLHLLSGPFMSTSLSSASYSF